MRECSSARKAGAILAAIRTPAGDLSADARSKAPQNRGEPETAKTPSAVAQQIRAPSTESPGRSRPFRLPVTAMLADGLAALPTTPHVGPRLRAI